MADEFAQYEDVVRPELEAAQETHTGAQTVYTGVRISGFKDMLLKPELLKAISDASFEHPSQVQHDCLHPAIQGQDILCQAKAGMGKTAVFVLPILHVLAEPADDLPRVVVVAHSKEMCLQIYREYERFAKYLDHIKNRIVKVHGGPPRSQDAEMFARVKPLIVIGTPGRLWDLAGAEQGAKKVLDLSKIEHFVIDECDRLLSDPQSLKQIIALYTQTPRDKQTMMLTATMPEEMRPVAMRFLRSENTFEKYVDSESKLTLHGLDQWYIKVDEAHKIALLFKLIDANKGYNQVIIFVNKVERAKELGAMMVKHSFPTYTIHGGMPAEERLVIYEAFKSNKQRFLVATELFARGVDVQAVNLVINYDCPHDRYDNGDARGPRGGAQVATGKKTTSGSDQYLHRIGRAGRFGTRGSAITFLSSAEDVQMMNEVRTRFGVTIREIKEDALEDLTKDLATTADA